MKNSIVALLALVLPAIPASGQWTTGADLGYVVDDNSFNNYLQISDRVTVFSLHGGYDWETEQSSLGLSYSGDVSAFDVNPSRTHYEHNAELSYARLFGEAETTLLTAGANYMLRDNRDEFTVYDHTQWSLHLNLRHLVSEISSLRFGYQFRSASFTELPDFDYMEHATFAQIGWAFPSRTSIIVQGDLNYKSYVTPNVDTTVNTPTGSGYHRARESQSTPGVTQLIGTVKIGQGFGGTTGLSLMGQYQLSIEKETRYLSFSDGTITDDELFDDHYGYEGPLASLMLTQLLPGAMRARVSATLQRRQYSDRSAYDLLGGLVSAQRIDNRTTISCSLEVPFESLGLSLALTYDRILNASNDRYYDYRNNAVMARIAYAY